MRRGLFWLSLPWVIPQAWWTRSQIPRFTGPPGDLNGQFGESANMRVMGLGDSIIAGVGATTPAETLTAQYAQAWHKQHRVGVSWKAYGRIGASTPKITALTKKIIDDEPFDIILISAGVNDILGVTRTYTWLRDLDTLIDTIHQKYPTSYVIFLGIPPLHTFPALPRPLRDVLGLRAKQFDELAMQRVTRRERCHYSRIRRLPSKDAFSTDGFHPSADSYRELAEMLVTDFTPTAIGQPPATNPKRNALP
jgi:lysophospholipase L1-like esterase